MDEHVAGPDRVEEILETAIGMHQFEGSLRNHLY